MRRSVQVFPLGVTLLVGVSWACSTPAAPPPNHHASRGRGAVAACVADLRNDPLNCGACGRACASADRTLPVCLDGQCVQVCRVGYGECDGDPVTGCETEVLRDPCHCSKCGARCPSGSFCVAGVCQGQQDALVRTGPPAPAACEAWRMPADAR